MSEIQDDLVKKGLWTNLARGPVMGQVITTDINTGTIVIAILAIVSSIGTAHLWHLLAFAFHQWRADGRHADGLYRQQQALLRTLPGPSSLMADSMKLYLAWRKRTTYAFAKSIAMFVVAVLCTIGTLAAGIASSYIVDTSNLEVLVRSPFCGALNQSSGVDSSIMMSTYKVAVEKAAQPYSDECYHNKTSLSARCKIFTKPFIPLEVEMSDCPWAPNMCVRPDDKSRSAVSIDSGLVDVNDAFGLNLADSDKIRFRKRTTCAVLPTGGYTKLMNTSDFPPGLWRSLNGRDPIAGEQAFLLQYGQRQYLDTWPNVTGAYNLLDSNLTTRFSFWGINHQFAKGPGDTFTPLDDMQRNDSDTAIIFISKHAVTYAQPSDDLIFGAHKENVQIDLDDGDNTTFYLPDSLFSPVACSQQYQFCTHNHCTDLSGLPTNISSSSFPDSSPLQLAALTLLHRANDLVQIADNNALNASSLVQNGWVVQNKIPADQWITEITGWEAYVWASLQVLISDHAVGPQVRETQVAPAVVPSRTEGERALCGVQKMRKQGGFVNINVFGLVFTMALSLTAALVDITLLKFLVFLSRFRKALAPRIDRWIQDGVLQLQRRAYEAVGEGTWCDLDKEVPLTRQGQLLSDLTVERRARYIGAIGLGLSVRDGDNGTVEKALFRRSETEATLANSLRSPTLGKKDSDEEARSVPSLKRYETERTLVVSPTLRSPR